MAASLGLLTPAAGAAEDPYWQAVKGGGQVLHGDPGIFTDVELVRPQGNPVRIVVVWDNPPNCFHGSNQLSARFDLPPDSATRSRLTYTAVAPTQSANFANPRLDIDLALGGDNRWRGVVRVSMDQPSGCNPAPAEPRIDSSPQNVMLVCQRTACPAAVPPAPAPIVPGLQFQPPPPLDCSLEGGFVGPSARVSGRAEAGESERGSIKCFTKQPAAVTAKVGAISTGRLSGAKLSRSGETVRFDFTYRSPAGFRGPDAFPVTFTQGGFAATVQVPVRVVAPVDDPIECSGAITGVGLLARRLKLPASGVQRLTYSCVDDEERAVKYLIQDAPRRGALSLRTKKGEVRGPNPYGADGHLAFRPPRRFKGVIGFTVVAGQGSSCRAARWSFRVNTKVRPGQLFIQQGAPRPNCNKRTKALLRCESNKRSRKAACRRKAGK